MVIFNLLTWLFSQFQPVLLFSNVLFSSCEHRTWLAFPTKELLLQVLSTFPCSLLWLGRWCWLPVFQEFVFVCCCFFCCVWFVLSPIRDPGDSSFPRVPTPGPAGWFLCVLATSHLAGWGDQLRKTAKGSRKLCIWSRSGVTDGRVLLSRQWIASAVSTYPHWALDSASRYSRTNLTFGSIWHWMTIPSCHITL